MASQDYQTEREKFFQEKGRKASYTREELGRILNIDLSKISYKYDEVYEILMRLRGDTIE
jgi:hypothetical protein